MAEDRGVEPRRAINPADFKSAALPIRLVLRIEALPVIICTISRKKSNRFVPGRSPAAPLFIAVINHECA